MTRTAMDPQVEDHLELLSHMYPGLYPEEVQVQAQAQVQVQVPSPEQGETKVRRRRKKSKAEGSGGGCARKRKLSAEQVTQLELNFGNEHKLESERKDRIASELGLDPRQVAVWFQNRRARWKNKKLEEEFSKLKMAHQTVLGDKCQLETEVQKLKDQLTDAEKEIRRLSEQRFDNGSNNSPTSSFSNVIDVDPPFFGDFGVVDAFDHVFYVPENNYQSGGWGYPYFNHLI